MDATARLNIQMADLKGLTITQKLNAAYLAGRRSMQDDAVGICEEYGAHEGLYCGVGAYRCAAAIRALKP